ncbi:sialic acid TRAP transporter substrate-binding protein SiaP [Dethiosulfatarculus sandiegensis]|uniref:ABC transporter substrate-binding protein n=1 Tax=Dethiosulfatarculus sandiegensis TaxID=1429043 RepID=A0A0D2GKN4_9BACT|nr:sialic acid TRAP transporter substrate-binding protein SiaP [Dethiosulfatarculus sandiegensis]KIX15317.1 ABC transporter substrate-binding protein [Dethiosulfatarculus sandiegensis]
MRKYRMPALMTALALAAVCVFSITPAFAAKTLKWAHSYEVDNPYHIQALWAAKEIAKRTDNRFVVKVFPASSLGKEVDINEGLTLGTVDIIHTAAAFTGRTYAPLAMSCYPYVFRNLDHFFAFAKSDIFRQFANKYTEITGSHVFCTSYYGARNVTTTDLPIRKPEQMANLKIRIPNAPSYGIFPKAVNANPTPIAFSEVYLALQQGVVDAQENPLTIIKFKKFFEVQKYICLTQHMLDNLLTICSGQMWNSLSDSDKKIFTDVILEMSDRISTDIVNAEKELSAWFEKQGNTVIYDVDRKAMAAKVAEYYKAHKSELPWTDEIWAKVQALK